jgi:hypothetical protein
MASTRNINTPGNYYLEQKEYKNSENYSLYPHSQYGSAYNTKLPGLGVNPAQIPWNQLSNNAADIESFLFGIDSTNLVNPGGPLVAELKNLETANFFSRRPTILPEPFVVEKGQRPFPCPK